MLYEIKNDKLSITADTFGAELHSIKLNGKEYLWQCGDAWKRYAPILFPFICSPKDRTYKAGGQEYHMAATTASPVTANLHTLEAPKIP